MNYTVKRINLVVQFTYSDKLTPMRSSPTATSVSYVFNINGKVLYPLQAILFFLRLLIITEDDKRTCE